MGVRCDLESVRSDGCWTDFSRLAHALTLQEPIKKMFAALVNRA
jgi:hypothetical protein